MSLPIDKLIHLLRNEQGFSRLFESLYAKYRSYERLEKQVTVLIEQPSREEREALGGLLGKDYSKVESIRISVARLEKAIRTTKFGHILEAYDFVQLVEAYFGQPLFSKREEAAQFLAERTAYFERLKRTSDSANVHRVLEWITKEDEAHNRFYQLFRHQREQLDVVMRVLLAACAALPLQEDTYLPLFASRITGDPHALDTDRDVGKYFIYMLQILNATREEQGSHVRTAMVQGELNAEETAELLLEYRILRDDLLNFVTLFHVIGVLQNGQESLFLQGARDDDASFHLPLKEVLRMKSVRAATEDNVIYMIENSGVTAHLINRLTTNDERFTTKLKRVSILSGNGRLNLATLRFLDLFVAGGGMIFYAGDFDPEGLGIAQKLLYRYGDRIQLWMYSVQDYMQSLSVTAITNERLKQLNGIDHPALQEVKERMRILQKAGYQENILDKMLNDLL